MTLPHEMSHFWLNTIFNDVKALNEIGGLSEQYMIEMGNLWEFLGITDEQTELTRDQQELFATLTEQYLTNKTALGKDTEYAISAYLEYVPVAYGSFLDFGYIDSNNKMQNPIMTEKTKDWFDRFFTSWNIDGLPTPKEIEIYRPTINPNKSDVKAREDDMSEEQSKQDTYTKNLREQQEEQLTPDEKIEVASQMREYEKEAEELFEIDDGKEETDGRWSFMRFGRETNTKKQNLGRERLFREAYKWSKKNPEKALEIAMGDPRFIHNDSPIDRGILIRVVRVNTDIVKDQDTKDELYLNFVYTKSMSGKTLGLSNDTHDAMFLEGIGKATINFEKKFLLKRYGKFKSDNEASIMFEKQLDKMVGEFGLRIKDDTSEENISRQIESMLRIAEETFGKADGNLLYQMAIPKSLLKNRNKFEAYAKKLIKEHVGALPSKDYEKELMTLATRAQVSNKDLNSMEKFKYIAASRAIADYQDFLIKSEIPLTISDKVISGLFSRAMLSAPSTHAKNLISNVIEMPAIKTALTAKYGVNEVSRGLMNEYQRKYTKIYENSLLSIPQMHTLTDKSLIAGEAYRVDYTNAINFAGKKFGGLTLFGVRTWIPDPFALLGRSDTYFRNKSYIATLAHIATKQAKKEGRSPDAVFAELNIIDQGTPSEARLEAILVSNISVFTQDGELAKLATNVRNSIDQYTAPLMGANKYGLGTMLIPYARTPSNIFQLGVEATVSPVSLAATYVKRKVDLAKVSFEINKLQNEGASADKIKVQQDIQADLKESDLFSTKQYIDVAHLISGFALYGLLVTALSDDYEPPYEVGQRYDRKKRYDSIKIDNTWIKLDALGIASIPVRLMLAAKEDQKWRKIAIGTAEQIPIDFGGIKYAWENPAKGIPSFIEGQATKAVPNILTSLGRPLMRDLLGEGYDYRDHIPFVDNYKGKIGSKIATRLGMDGRARRDDFLIHMWASFISVDKK